MFWFLRRVEESSINYHSDCRSLGLLPLPNGFIEMGIGLLLSRDSDGTRDETFVK